VGGYTQENRPLNVNTPLGENVLLLERFSGTEGIHKLFEYNLTMVSESQSLDLTGLLRKPVTIGVRLPDDSFRYINGWVKSARQLERDRLLTTYQADVVPWTWFLGQSWDCRIFQKKTVQEIITDVFSKGGYSDYQFKLYGSYEPRTYCVQYRESNLNFVLRLMEEEGMFYFYEQSDGKHTMVITDSKAAVKPCPHLAKARYAYQPQGGIEEDFVHTFDAEDAYRTGKVALQDFDFIKPSSKLDVNVSGKNAISELYDYPGRYYDTGRGDKLARVRLEESEIKLKTSSGISTCRGMEGGYKFELQEHYNKSLNQEWLVTNVNIFTAGNNYRSEMEEPFEFTNTFEVMPAKTQYRPPRTALKPIVRGLQTAIVTGPKGEEIYCDKYGRVKVQFHWDREGKYDENSSCWVRVSAAWAGKAWGWITIPRIGQEVQIDHMEGDPDRPIITGRVYNAEQEVPYKLPDHKTQSTFKSRSSMKGSASNFCELRIEDLKGKEQVFIHSEYDQDNRSKNDSREWVGRDKHVIVTSNQKELVKADKHLHVKGKQEEKIDGDFKLKVGGSQHDKVGQLYALEAGQEIHEKAGMKVVIEAGMELTLKGPGGFIKIDPSGIYINGLMVYINSGGSPGSGTACEEASPSDVDIADDGSKVTKMGSEG
jgi:type VI secretion system secreted protein VgrG